MRKLKCIKDKWIIMFGRPRILFKEGKEYEAVVNTRNGYHVFNKTEIKSPYRYTSSTEFLRKSFNMDFKFGKRYQ